MQIDYDSMYVPSLQGENDEIKGLVGYQHPSRWKCKDATPKADYFSELVIYLTLRSLAKFPKLWEELRMEDTETLLFDAEDIESKGNSDIFKFLQKDKELKPLAEKISEFLLKSSIEDLEPLENALISKADGIAGKWKKGNGYTPKTPNVDNPGGIATKWSGGNGYKPFKQNNHNELLEKISSKFNKPE